MQILFDNGTPRGLASFLTGHSVEEARARRWEELKNGELIDSAEAAGFDVMVTTDKNIRYQQNLKDRKIALVVLEHSQWPMVKLVAHDIVARHLHSSARAIQGMSEHGEDNVMFRNRLRRTYALRDLIEAPESRPAPSAGVQC